MSKSMSGVGFECMLIGCFMFLLVQKSLGVMTGFFDETETETNNCFLPGGFRERALLTTESKWLSLKGPIFHGEGGEGWRLEGGLSDG